MISLKEYILQELAPRMPLYEQALHRSEFISKTIDIIDTLLSHWGLIEYAHGDYENNNSYEQYVEHWKKELRGFCNQIISKKIKGGDQKNAISHTFINKLELNDWEVVYDMIRDKLEDKDIDIFTIKRIAKYLSENINELIIVLANKSYREWIDEL